MNKALTFKYLFVGAMVFFSYGESAAQISFERVYDPSYLSYGKELFIVNDGYILAGGGILARTDEFGDTLWTRNIPNFIQMVMSDDSILAFISDSSDFSGPIYHHAFISKYTIAGDSLERVEFFPFDTTLQNLFYPGTNPRGICKSFDGGFLVSGFFTDTSFEYFSFVMKLDSVFNTVWKWTENIYDEQLLVSDIIETSDHSVLIMDERSSGGNAPHGSTLVKLDSLGIKKWDSFICSYHGNNGIAETQNHTYVVTGSSTPIHIPIYTYLLKEFDTFGNLLWSNSDSVKTFGAICSAPNGRIAVTGLINAQPYFHSQLYLSFYNSSGNILSTHTYRTDIFSGAVSVRQTPDFGFIICGIARDTFPANAPSKLYLIKTDSLGNILSSGINIVDENKISIFPNPVTDKLNINLAETGNYRMYLYNSSGSLIFESKKMSENITINFSNYPSGIYFVRMKNENNGNSYSTKLIRIE